MALAERDRADATHQVDTRTHTARQQPVPRSQSADSPARLGYWACALAIVGLAVVMHVWQLTSAPGWDPEEGYNLDVAWNLMHGQLRLFALSSAFAQHPPLFYLQLGLAIRLFGYGMVAIRALVALYAVLTCVAVIAVGQRMLGWAPALWGGLVFTVAPLVLMNTRLGYSYTQLALVGVLCLGAAWRYVQVPSGQRLALAAGLAGLAACCDYVGIAWVLLVALLALRQWPRHLPLALGLGLGVLGANLLACLATAPSVFVADVSATGARAAGGNVPLQLINLLLNYQHLLTFDPWVVLGIVGLFLVADARARGLLLASTVVLALVVLKVRTLAGFHTAVPLLPLLALGAGVALDLGLRRVYAESMDWVARDWHLPSRVAARVSTLAAVLIVFLAVVSPLGMTMASDAVTLATPPPTATSPASGATASTAATPADAARVFGYLLPRLRAGDLVLASPQIAWRFDGPPVNGDLSHRMPVEGADILQVIVQSGRADAFYPARVPAWRWSYAVSLARSRYVIVDNLVRALATPDQDPALVPVLQQIETWPVIYRAGQYSVYAQPDA